ncbi:fatty-acid--CoA ligase [Rhodococcus pyridinivorans KG-16]|uniref:Fatty-acid--CoA ligase n=1 Tax=Rhodococcus pyridinivorans KG-16 TaxID=1441730 RepID=A0A0V9UER6_9NOCA|nr:MULTISPECIES: long-chain-fatty-acid--CoA ligase [Rhodococcus]KSZ56375.1 fatty-acid--CoA ligase [Rhodococcus pyridinivorans KG-16]MBS9372329.1 Long-chain-fatty-acid--CoA ligase FadD13 [Rhodococcus sp. B50]
MTYRLADEPRRHALERPDVLALTGRGMSLTYRELDRRTNRLANVLRERGIGPQSRVAVLDKSSPQVIEVLFAAAKIGAVTVPANWRLAAPELAEVLSDAGAEILFFHSAFEDTVSYLRAHAPALSHTIRIDGDGDDDYETLLAAADATDPGWTGDADDIVLQLYTSGTTARPKGVLSSNRNLGACTQSGGPWGFDSSSVSLCAMPLFHIGGLGWVLVGIANGAHNIIVTEFTPQSLLDELEHHRITNTFLVPSVIGMLVEVPGAAERNFTALRSIAYGSSPITPALLKRALATFDRPLFQVYGLTETHGAITQLDATDHTTEGDRTHLLRSVGKPYPWVELKIVQPHSTDPAETGEVGEICVRSPQNTVGYFHRPEETSNAIDAEGWFHTGDVGRFDQDGYLYITDRIKDLIISGGENVYPIEVESVIAEYPGVSQVAVIGVPDPMWGEAVKAVVVTTPGQSIDARELSAFARERLAGYKCPKTIDVVQSLPLGATGKILKRELREQYAQQLSTP